MRRERKRGEGGERERKRKTDCENQAGSTRINTSGRVRTRLVAAILDPRDGRRSKSSCLSSRSTLSFPRFRRANSSSRICVRICARVCVCSSNNESESRKE